MLRSKFQKEIISSVYEELKFSNNTTFIQQMLFFTQLLPYIHVLGMELKIEKGNIERKKSPTQKRSNFPINEYDPGILDLAFRFPLNITVSF